MTFVPVSESLYRKMPIAVTPQGDEAQGRVLDRTSEPNSNFISFGKYRDIHDILWLSSCL